MIKLFKNKKTLIFALLLLISILPFFLNSSADNEHALIKGELFRNELSYLNTVQKIQQYVDSIYLTKKVGSTDTSLYVQILSKTIKERFHYGQANYSVSDNWIAYLSGKLLWSHLSAIVDPDEILKHPEGLCSQQTIVFMEILEQKQIKVRSVGLGYKNGPGHFLCEVKYKDKWHLHDVTLEPRWNKISGHHESMEYYLTNKDSLYLVYEHCWTKNAFNTLTSMVVYGKSNEFPAKKMLLFHQTSKFLTYFIPLICGFLLLQSIFKKRKSASNH